MRTQTTGNLPSTPEPKALPGPEKALTDCSKNARNERSSGWLRPPIPPPAPGVVTVRLSGEVPLEQWNELGIKLIAKLRSTNGLHIEVVMSAHVDGKSAPGFMDDLRQAISDLNLEAKLSVTHE
jgi:hypothetical protein